MGKSTYDKAFAAGYGKPLKKKAAPQRSSSGGGGRSSSGSGGGGSGRGSGPARPPRQQEVEVRIQFSTTSSDRALQASSGYSNTGRSASDAVSNRNGGRYSQIDAVKETGATLREGSAAWHQARDDHERDQSLPDRHNGGWEG